MARDRVSAETVEDAKPAAAVEAKTEVHAESDAMKPRWLLKTPTGEEHISSAETVEDAIREMNGNGHGKVWTYRSLTVTKL